MKKGIYIIPSLFTLGNIVMGFLSVIDSINGNFTRAAWFIIIAGIFDILDGFIARVTNSTSSFGVQLDSLCDVVSFGIAPAILMYQFVMYQYIHWGAVICIIYVVAATLRLARFNVSTINNQENSYSFKGLPTPAAGYILASFVLVDNLIGNNITRKIIPLIMNKFYVLYNLIPILVILISYAMVSNISYMSLKSFKFRKAKTMREIILVCIGLVLIWRFPENMLFIIFLVYFLSGILDIVKKLSKVSELLNKKRIKNG